MPPEYAKAFPNRGKLVKRKWIDINRSQAIAEVRKPWGLDA
jgi:hypothetical protein